MLAAFAVMSAWVLLLGLWWTLTQGRIWTGVNGVYVQDVTQYLAWIRDASRHVLVSDLFVSSVTPHDYLQPAIAVSGGLVALGVAPWLALLLWQPVAVGGMFLAVRSLVHSQLRARRARRAALVLALFGGSIGTFQDLWLPWWTWGYVFGVLSLATMVASLLLYDLAVRGAAPVWPAAVLAGLASWLHPWQGAVLGLTIVGAEIMVLTQPRGRRAAHDDAAARGRPSDWSRSRCRSPTTRCSVVPTRRGGWPESRSKEGSPSGRCC